MTDLISQLADSLIALINASPRSPRKDEIEEVIAKHMPPQALATPRMLEELAHPDAAELGSVVLVWPDSTISIGLSTYSTLKDAVDYLVSQEELVKAADQICSAIALDESHTVGRDGRLTRVVPCLCGRTDTHFDTPVCLGLTEAEFEARSAALFCGATKP